MKSIFNFFLVGLICLTTFSCQAIKSTETSSLNKSAEEFRMSEETQSVSSLSALLSRLSLDSVIITYVSPVPDSSPKGIMCGEVPVLKQTQSACLGSGTSPRSRFAALPASPPNHPPAGAVVKAYGIRLDTEAKAKSTADLYFYDSVQRYTQSEVKAGKSVVKPTGFPTLWIAVAAIIMAAAAIFFIRRGRIL